MERPPEREDLMRNWREDFKLHWLLVLLFLLALGTGFVTARYLLPRTPGSSLSGPPETKPSPGPAPLLPPSGPKPPPNYKAALGIIIDDAGGNEDLLKKFLGLGIPLTISFLPEYRGTAEQARLTVAEGKEAFLHLPMEPENPEMARNYPGMIMTGMTPAQIEELVRRHLERVPGVAGVNNHEGSKATADQAVMKVVLSVLKEKGLPFVDSRTSAHSVAYKVAREMGVPAGENQVFLDNEKIVEKIKGQLRLAARLALKRASPASLPGLIAIGHLHPATLEALAETIGEIQQMGVTFVPARQLTK